MQSSPMKLRVVGPLEVSRVISVVSLALWKRRSASMFLKSRPVESTKSCLTWKAVAALHLCAMKQ